MTAPRSRAAAVLAGVLCVLLGISLAEAVGVQLAGPFSHLRISGQHDPFPALPPDVARVPLARPVSAPAGQGGYVFLEHEDDGSGAPVRWDPCRPIHYVVRQQGAPPGGQEAVTSSIALLEQITGLRFVFDGWTAETPVADRPTIQPKRYGDRWAPVLVAWTGSPEYPAMADYAGLGGPDAVAGRVPGRRRYVSGVVLLNRSYLAETMKWPGGQERLDAVVLHEFGHLAGLDHVDDPGQLMYKQPTPKEGGFAAGDRRGLALLANGPCYRDY